MKNLIVTSIVALCLFTFSSTYAQNIVDVQISTFHLGKKVKKVDYTLLLNNEELVSLNRRNGRFEFAIQPDDGTYDVVIEKEGYITKKLKIKSTDFKFKYEYEFQEIEVEMLPGTDELEKVTVSKELVKTQSTPDKVVPPVKVEVDNSKIDSTLKIIDGAYDKAISYGDNLAALEEYDYAKGYYEIASDLKPNESYPKDKLLEMVSKAREQKITDGKKHDEHYTTQTNNHSNNISALPAGVYFSVQLGAFLKRHDQKVFSVIDAPIIISGQDEYTRVLSGNFNSRDEARRHLEEVIAMGFEDAFIVQMQKNIRIGM